MGLNRNVKATRVHLTPYLRGVIVGLALAGWSCRDIAQGVEKPDGTHPCQQSVADVLQTAKEVGRFKWAGEHQVGTAGRPRLSTPALDKAIKNVVFKKRGSIV